MNMLNFLTYQNQEKIISDVKIFKLKVNRDDRGLLIENLKANWQEIFNDKLPFGQNYCSVTNPGFARDENLWHQHPAQTDRFVVVKGSAIFALFDGRANSKTKDVLNLFLMGEKNGDDNQYLLTIPPEVLHGFCTVGKDPCYLLGFPTLVYDPKEEGRVPFEKAGVTFTNGLSFSWESIRQSF